MNSHSRQLRNFYLLGFPKFDVNVFYEIYNPFKDFQSDQIQRGSRKVLIAHYACGNADCLTGTTNGFIFQMINSLIESCGVRLTCLDCNILPFCTKKNSSLSANQKQENKVAAISPHQPPLNSLSWGRLGTKRERRWP